MRRLAALLLLALTVLGAPAAGLALAATPKTSLVDIEDEVMCVSCHVPLNIAESAQANSERREIQRLIDQGLTKAQVKDRLVDQYGPNVLGLPKGDGFNLAVYLVPVAVVIGLVSVAAVLLPRWRRTRDERVAADNQDDGEPDPSTVLSDDDATRLDAELAAFDR